MAATAATAAALDAQGFRSLLSEQAELFKKLQGERSSTSGLEPSLGIASVVTSCSPSCLFLTS
jgi:hypothetical protein